jgi:type IV secretory pathway VirB2 component (pilin)
LGLKYIWSSAEGKAEVQESLPTFVIGVICFYLAGAVFDHFKAVTSGMAGASNWQELSGNAYWIIATIAKYLSLAGIMIIGLRYMFASAEGRASLKTSFGGAVLGLAFVFLASNVVTFITTTAREILY